MSHQRNRTSHTTRRTAMCAVLAALAVVVLGIGTLIEIMDLSAAIAASAVVLLVFLCYGTRYALLTYAVISVLGILLMPQSLAVWTFAGLLGYYPIIKEKLDRLPCVLAWIVKFLLFAAVLGLCFLLFHFLILGGAGSLSASFVALFGGTDGTAVIAWIVLALTLVVYVLFDHCINRLRTAYRVKWHRRVEKWMKP